MSGNTVELNLPLFFDLDPALSPQAVLVRGSSMVRRAGVEDLALTQVEPVNDFIVEMDAAQHCWLRNVDVSRMKRRGVWHVESLQNEIQGSVFHDAIAGFGRDRGYGAPDRRPVDGQPGREQHLLAVDGGGVMTSGGAIGNVLAYNYLPDIRFDDPWWMIGGPVDQPLGAPVDEPVGGQHRPADRRRTSSTARRATRRSSAAARRAGRRRPPTRTTTPSTSSTGTPT